MAAPRDGHARERWGTRVGFLFAAAGSAVGLGNIWRFPYIMGENGGAAFVAVYLLCILLVGVPVFLAELTIGRAARRNPVGAFSMLAPGTAWVWVGRMGVAAGFLALSFYSIVSGWVIYYLGASLSGQIVSLHTAQQAAAAFSALTADPWLSLSLHAVFMLLTVAVVARGVRGGIERISKVLMPLLVALLVVLILRGVTLPGGLQGVSFLLLPDLGSLDSKALLTALGHAFFTLSVGMGAMITYGSYLADDADMPKASLQVAGMDTLIAIAAGFAIFPALFALGMQPQQGPGLIFLTLPVVFAGIPFGAGFAAMFFLLVLLAAVTSSISMLEVVAAALIDERGWSRARAAWIPGGLILLAGVPVALAQGPWADWNVARLLGVSDSRIWGSISILSMNWFDLVTHVVSDLMLPVGGLCMALFVTRHWSRREVLASVRAGSSWAVHALWLRLLGWVVPVVVAEVLVLGLLTELPGATFPRTAAWAAQARPWLVVIAAAVTVAGLLAEGRRYLVGAGD